MSFDRAALARAVAAHGRVARVVVAEVAGSTPREVGAAMLVWAGGQAGTIGGGTLEYEAARRALTGAGLSRHALGPDLGQCCGGRVTLLTEIFDAEAVAAVPEGGLFARGPGEMPLSVRRHLSEARGQGVIRAPQLIDGWMVEPVTRAQRPLWIWGRVMWGAPSWMCCIRCRMLRSPGPIPGPRGFPTRCRTLSRPCPLPICRVLRRMRLRRPHI